MVHVKGLNDMGRFKPLACGVTRFITKSYVQVATRVMCNLKTRVFHITQTGAFFFLAFVKNLQR